MGSTVGTQAASPSSGSRLLVLRGALGRGGTNWMLGGSLLAGLGAYLFQVVGARTLGEFDYAPISVLWTVQYLLSAVVMTALESWVVRTTTAAHGSVVDLRAAAPRLIAAVLAVTALVSLVAFLGRDLLLPGHSGLVVVIPVLVLSYSVFVVVRGVLAARERYKAYGGVTALESVLRLAAAVVVALTIPSAALLALTLPLGALGGAAWGLTSRLRGRSAEVVSSPSPMALSAASRGAPGRFLAVTGGANAAAQVLLAGSPLLLGPLGATPRDVSVLFVTITAARVPLVIVQGGLLSRLLPTFTRMANTGATRALTSTGNRMVWGTAAVAVAAAVLGWLAGPWLLGALFGSGFEPSSRTAAGVAAGVVIATGGMLVNQVLIACRREGALLVPWWCGLLVAGAAIVLNGDAKAMDRILLGFVIGEVTALILLAHALRSTRLTVHDLASAATQGDRA